MALAMLCQVYQRWRISAAMAAAPVGSSLGNLILDPAESRPGPHKKQKSKKGKKRC